VAYCVTAAFVPPVDPWRRGRFGALTGKISRMQVHQQSFLVTLFGTGSRFWLNERTVLQDETYANLTFCSRCCWRSAWRAGQSYLEIRDEEMMPLKTTRVDDPEPNGLIALFSWSGARE